jgi:hypothetical protein
MAFVFGWIAHALGAHMFTIALAALAGIVALYSGLAYLRKVGPRWPMAYRLEMLIMFTPSALAAGLLVFYFMTDEWNRSLLESVPVSLITGVLFGLLAYGSYLQKRGLDRSAGSDGGPST